MRKISALSPLMTLIFGLMAALTMSGCYTPAGGILPWSGGPATYYSTSMMPMNVTLIDVRTEEEVFRVDIPVGKQLTLQFFSNQGSDTVHRPDLMRYEIFDIGTKFGHLSNSITIPNQWSRRLDVSMRDGPEYAEHPPYSELRTDEVLSIPADWTPQGGPPPKDIPGLENYDDQ